MQRVRIGLTGLGFVFIAVLLAAVFTSGREEEAPITVNTVEQGALPAVPPAAPPPADAVAPSEPLADLGVAPGAADENAALSANAQSGAAQP